MNIFDIILLAVFTFFIFTKLYNVLGRKDLDLSYKDIDNILRNNSNNNKSKNFDLEKEIEEDYSSIDDSLIDKIKEIKKYYPDFKISLFIEGTKNAFEIIIKAFSECDIDTLKGLLENTIFKSFKESIIKMEKEGSISEAIIICFNSVNIIDVNIEKKIARIKVEFNTDQVNLVKDKEGNILEGDKTQVDKMTDIWIFKKDLSKKDPVWLLEETLKS